MRRVKAILRIETGGKGYREFPVQAAQSYAIETAMDGDADPFSIDVADPHNHFGFLRDRDTEVLANIFSGTNKAIEQLHFGISDDVNYDSSDRVLSIVGRDFSSVAVDSDCPPGEFKHAFPNQIIKRRALDLGFTKILMPPLSSVARIWTDGSETEWEFWYRLMREKDMWLWTLPDSTLVGGKLAYSAVPTYFFGKPEAQWPHQKFIKVERIQHRSNKSQRLQEVWMYGETGQDPLFAQAQDKTIAGWTRRNLKIELNAQAKNKAELKKEAEDEVFDSIVGAIEFTLTIRDTGIRIKPNKTARVNLPKHDVVGTFFIVGVRLLGDESSGYFQEIRLRQRNFALSRRVPDAPELEKDKSANETTEEDPSGNTAANVLAAKGVRWADAFIRAAMAWHKGSGKNEQGRSIQWDWDIAAFLGCLLAICQVETTFLNNRILFDGNHFTPGPEYTDAPDATELDKWKHLFGNEKGSPYNPTQFEAGVGPMRLHTKAHKEEADRSDLGDPAVEPSGAGNFTKWTEVGATVFGGPNDKGTGHLGHVHGKEFDLNDLSDSYAELSTNTTNLANDGDPDTDNDYAALGDLPAEYPMQIRNPTTGKIVVGKKRDVGYGQGATILPGGHRAMIDLWYTLANDLGMEGWSGYGGLEIADAGVGKDKETPVSNTGTVNQFYGNRWTPEANIWIAAKVLAQYKGGKYSSNDYQNLFAPGGCVDGFSERPNFVTNVKNWFNRQYYAWAKEAIGAATPTSDKPLGGAFTLSWRSYGAGNTQYPADSLSFPSMPKETEQAIRAAVKWVDADDVVGPGKRGTPYHWGGGTCAGPTWGEPHAGSIGLTGFDCSGLILYAWCVAGIVMPEHFTGDYQKKGKAVKLDQIKPGDLVFFHYEGGVSQHMGMYLNNNLMIEAPGTGDYVRVSDLRSDVGDIRRLVDYEGTSSSGVGKKKVMIQAGHDEDGHGDQPYGHTGESGATGPPREMDWTIDVRDTVLGHLNQDDNFIGVSGSAWSASAGETASSSDDVDWAGDIFISLHHDVNSAGNAFFFGYTRGGTDGRSGTQSSNSTKLADKIAAQIEQISGHPTRTADNSGFGGSPANSTGWGYYAWGSTLRASPDDVNHLPGVDAAIIMECGKADNESYLTSKKPQIARAIYEGICNYYGLKPQG